jgi:hypothetical protein
MSESAMALKKSLDFLVFSVAALLALGVPVLAQADLFVKQKKEGTAGKEPSKSLFVPQNNQGSRVFNMGVNKKNSGVAAALAPSTQEAKAYAEALKSLQGFKPRNAEDLLAMASVYNAPRNNTLSAARFAVAQAVAANQVQIDQARAARYSSEPVAAFGAASLGEETRKARRAAEERAREMARDARRGATEDMREDIERAVNPPAPPPVSSGQDAETSTERRKTNVFVPKKKTSLPKPRKVFQSNY